VIYAIASDLTVHPQLETPAHGHLLAAIDMDGDEREELLFAESEGWTLTDLAGNELGRGEGPGVDTIVVRDLDGDGLQDVVLAVHRQLKILRGRRDGTPTVQTVTLDWAGDWPPALVTGDVNGDGRVDVVVIRSLLEMGDLDHHTRSVLQRPGFEFELGPLVPDTDPDVFPRLAIDARLADEDGDGVLDLITLNVFVSAAEGDPATFDFVGVQRGRGDGGFVWERRDPMEGFTQGWGWLDHDLNADGLPDAVSCDFFHCAMRLATGEATYDGQVPFAGPYLPRWIGVLDLDRDGDDDLVMADNNQLTLLRRADGELGSPEPVASGEWLGPVVGTTSGTLWLQTFRTGSCEDPCTSGTACDGGPCGAEACVTCTLDADCGQGLCLGGACVECEGNAGCDGDSRCRDHQCERVVSTEGGWVDVATGGPWTCGLRQGGEVRCWGDGAESPAGRFSALEVAPEPYGCGVGVDGQLRCWGAVPDGVPGMEALDVSLSYGYGCALGVDGEVTCWGSSRMATWPLPSGPFTRLATGPGSMCGLRPDGQLTCWGCNQERRLYPECDSDRAGTPPGGSYQAVGISDFLVCGHRLDETVVCWGGPEEPGWEPEGRFVQLSSRGTMNCGIHANGAMECWGPEVDPTEDVVTDHGPFQLVRAGHTGVCGLRTDGHLVCDVWRGGPIP